jgi:hypothetical protein
VVCLSSTTTGRSVLAAGKSRSKAGFDSYSFCLYGPLVAKTPDGFVSLKSLKQGPPDSASALAEIRRIYFKTTRQTIDHDFAHAIELLKSLPSEDEREKATVYMQGLAEMQRNWAGRKKSRAKWTRGRSGKIEK